MSKNKRDLILLTVVLVVLTGILPLLMWSPFTGYMHGMWGVMGYGGFMTVFLVLIAVGAYYLITEFTGTDGGKRPLEILKERYAKGEITSEQYFKMKEELKS